jgi:hypothetical protein
MYQSIYEMDPKAPPPPPRSRPQMKRTNIVSGRLARQQRLEVEAAREQRLLAEAKAQAELFIQEAQAAVAAEEDRPTPVIDIIKDVAHKHGVTVAEIRGQRRDRHLVAARHEAMKLAYEQRPDMSLPAIAKVFRRDHTTFLHAVKKEDVWRNPGRPVELRKPEPGWLQRVLLWARGWFR